MHKLLNKVLSFGCLTFLLGIVFFSPKLHAQLIVDSTVNISNLVGNVLVGSGVSVSNISYSGSNKSIGKFTNGNSTNIGIHSGILLSTGNIANSIGPNLFQNKSFNTLQGSDPQLAALVPGQLIYDASVLEFDFIPQSDTLKFRYVFASEEYPEWVSTGYNDVFGFFVSGQNPVGGSYSFKNIATLPGTSIPLTINTVNNGQLLNGPCTNCQYYVNNCSGTTIEYDGFTTVLTSWILVNPCTSYHIKIAIGDVGDHSYDSGVFLEEHSFSASIPTISSISGNAMGNTIPIEGCNNSTIKFKLPQTALFPQVIHYSIGGSATNGVDYTLIPDSVIIPAGSDSAVLVIQPLQDALVEGQEFVQITVHSSACNYDTVLIPIVDYQSLNVTIGGDSSLCFGDSSLLNGIISGGKAPFSYVWNTGQMVANVNVTPSSNQVYWLKVSDACLHISSDTIETTVHPIPIVQITSNSSTICEGLSTELTAVGALNFNWVASNSLSSIVGNKALSSPTVTTNYSVQGVDGFGCKDSAQITINVNNAPIINLTSTNSYTCLGDSITLNATGATSYSWSPIDGLSTTVGCTVLASPNSNTVYKVVGIGANGCIDSAEIAIEVKSLPTISITPATDSVCLGTIAHFQASGAVNYAWIPDTTLSSLNTAFVMASATQSTHYFVKSTDGFGCESFDSVYLHIFSLPIVTTNINSSLMCFKDSVCITADGANSYSWSPNYAITCNQQKTVKVFPSSNLVYTVTGFDGNGCSDTANVNVLLTSTPSISSLALSICNGDSTIITANSSMLNSSYSWNTGEFSQSIKVKPSISTLYTVSITDTLGCSADTSVFIEVIDKPILTLNQINPVICKGQNVNLVAFGASNFNWFPANDLNVTMGSQVTANPTITTNYTLIGINNAGCVDSLPFTINVNPLPIINLTPSDTDLCPGSSIVITASGQGLFSWYPNNGFISANGDSMTVIPSTSTKYIVKAKSVDGCINSDTSLIRVSPTASIQSQFSQICYGDSVKLIANSNISTIKYLWNTGSSNSYIWVKPSTTTTYFVSITDTIKKCTNLASKTIIVDYQPLVTVSPANATICANQNIRLNASGATNYSWTPINGLSSTSGNSVLANPIATTTYRLIGSGASGCADTAYALITVIPNVNTSINFASTTICKGDSVQIDVSGATSYSWHPANTVSNPLASSNWVKPNNTTTYTIIGKEAGKCNDTITSTVNVISALQLYVSTDSINLCKGDSIQLDASGASFYQWSPSTGLSTNYGSQVIASPSENTYYQLIGINNLGCKDSMNVFVGIYPKQLNITTSYASICPGDTVPLSVKSCNNYLWNPSPLWLDADSSNAIASPISTTIYTIIGENEFGCFDTVYSQITVSPNPIISMASPHFCFGDSVYLIASSLSGQPTYTWNTGSINDSIFIYPTANTTYSLLAIDTNGCQANSSIDVIVRPLPTITVNPTIPTICPGSSISFLAAGAKDYQWSPNFGLSDTTGNFVWASPSTPTTYTVLGMDTFGCKDTAMFDLAFYPQPVVSTNILQDTICQGDSVLLIGYGATYFDWSVNSINFSASDSVWVKPTSTTVYRLIGSTISYCTDTVFVPVIVFEPAPIVGVDGVCPGLSATLTANSSAFGASYHWSTGSNLSSISVNPTIQTTYTLTTTYAGFCSLTSSKVVSIWNDATVQINAQKTYACAGGSVELNAVNCANYLWSPAGTLSSSMGSTVSASPTIPTLYKVTGISFHGCESKDSMFISIKQNPNVTINPTSALLCIGDSVLLNSNGASTYQWSPSSGLSSCSSSSVFTKPMASQIYSVKGTDAFGCSDTAIVSITVDNGPNTNIQPQYPFICIGDTIQLTASGAVNYSWYPNLWSISCSGANFSAVPASNISYHVIGTNANGCKKDTFVFVNVRRQPPIQISQSALEICLGDSVVLNASGAESYSWTPTQGLNTIIGTTVIAHPLNTTTYSVTGMSTDGCYKKLNAQIIVHPRPLLTIGVNDSVLCIGDTLIQNAYSNLAQTSYLWGTGQTVSSLNYIPITNLTLRLKGSSNFGCVDSISRVIQVNPLPQLSINPDSISICMGQAALITASSNNASTFHWNTGATTAAINPSPIVNTIYSVTITDSNQCKNSKSTQVKVYQQQNVSIIQNADSICFGDSIPLLAVGNSSIIHYIWNTLDSTQSIMVTPQTTQNYVVVATDLNGCKSNDTATIIVRQLPFINLCANPSEICFGDSSLLTVSSSASPITYLWSNGQTVLNQYFHPNSSTIYSVTATDVMGCKNSATKVLVVNELPTVSVNPPSARICSGSQLNLQASCNHQASFVWNTGSVSSSLVDYPTNNITYFVSVTDNKMCKNDTLVHVTTMPKPIVQINPEIDTICQGDSIILNTNSTTLVLSYLWNTGDTTNFYVGWPHANSQYIVVVTDTNQCTGTDTAFVMVKHRPTCYISANSPICSNDITLVSYTGDATNYAISNWNFDGGIVLNGNGTNPHSLQWQNQGNYLVTLSVTQDGCTSISDTAEVEVHQSPIANFETTNLIACLNQNVNFNCLNDSINTYHWDFGNPYSIVDTSNQQNPLYAYSALGVYSVYMSITDINGCFDDTLKQQLIETKPSPIADFKAKPYKTNLNNPKINFLNLSSNESSYAWDFDDLNSLYNTSSIENPFHVYSDTGDYFVRLIVSNDFGCTDTSIQIIEIENDATLFIPDAFSPNGDGLNDYFFPVSLNFDWSTYSILIFNRWGKIIYKGNDPTPGWDGKDQEQSSDCPLDVYTYIITIKDLKGKAHQYTGRVTIIR